MKEKHTTDGINECLKSHGGAVSFYRPVPGVHGARHLDYIVCAYGSYAAIEAKREGLEPTDAQYIKLKAIEAAQGATFAINSDAGIVRLYQWLARKRDEFVPDPFLPTIPFRHIKIIR